jgi:hypothetical protein
MYQTSPNNIPPQRPLMTLRIIWFALLVGPIAFLAAMEFGIFSIRGTQQAQPLFFWVDLAMLLTTVPITYGIRYLIFRRASIDGSIPATAFSTGNIIFWAGCEGVAFSGLVFALLNGSLWPTIVVVAIAMGLQVLTFPTGKRLYDPTTPA